MAVVTVVNGKYSKFHYSDIWFWISDNNYYLQFVIMSDHESLSAETAVEDEKLRPSQPPDNIKTDISDTEEKAVDTVSWIMC